jgi:predicted nucleotide-binding protein
MSEPTKGLLEVAERLKTYAEDPALLNALEAADELQEEAERIGRAWSRSWLGYHANVYYEDLTDPPPGAHFSSEWGFEDGFSEGTRGSWREYRPDDIRDAIRHNCGNPDLSTAQKLCEKGFTLVHDARAEIQSILEICVAKRSDNYLARLMEDVEKAEPPTASEFVKAFRPSGKFASRDMRAIQAGLWTPPHIAVISETASLRAPRDMASRLADLARKAASHLARLEQRSDREARIGTNVFIGHGGSRLWKDLKDFIQDRLRLPWDEFNRVPVAGVTNIARLSEMLDSAAFAFVVLTAEDEQVDGKLRARMNVIHEVGLFQGRLGFTKAIVLLEEGCEEFSNIQGLGQIRFPKGRVDVAFEEVRRVLEREGVIDPPTS